MLYDTSVQVSAGMWLTQPFNVHTFGIVRRIPHASATGLRSAYMAARHEHTKIEKYANNKSARVARELISMRRKMKIHRHETYI